MFDKTCFRAALAIALGAAGAAQAQPDTGTVTLAPGAAYSAAGVNQTPAAWTFIANPDLWTFVLPTLSFASGAQIGLTIGDDYTSNADTYRVYWDGSVLGTTASGASSTFNFASTAGSHELKVEWLTFDGAPPTDPGGSYYNLNIVAQVPEPQTAALTLAGLALLGLLVRRRRGA